MSIGALKPMPLDELFLDLGNPITNRSMGTLNETTLGWSLRTADFSNGVARFYWAEFERGLVVVRLDSPSVGAYPSADAAVSCTLPSAGAGKVWKSPDASTYVNPVIGRAMRGQDTTLNNGATRTTISLPPYHAAFFIRA
jgi:hypothetical protein